MNYITITYNIAFLRSIGGATAKDAIDRCLSEVFAYGIGKLYTWEGRSQSAKRDGGEPMKALQLIRCIFGEYYELSILNSDNI